MRRFCLVLISGFIPTVFTAQAADFSAYRDKMPADLASELVQDKSIRLIVRYSDAAVDAEIEGLERKPKQDRKYKASVLKIKAQRYHDLKDGTTAKMDNTRFNIDRDYSHLPMNVVTIKGDAGLLALLADPTVAEVYRDVELHHFLAQSAPLIRSTDVLAQTAYNGANTTVVVLDTGINYALSDFGNCTSPGVPASCRVTVAQDLATEDNALDAHGHGTNVSGIVAGIAKGTQLAVFDVFDGASASSSVVIQGINWAIANQLSYNISSINMSLGDASQNASTCSSGNPFKRPIANAYSAGILTVIASGNSGFSAGLAMPACTPQAVSVGAVYDSNVGGANWGICTDNPTATNMVSCFSNSSTYLSLLAPGSQITAAGSTMGGTSQATPHVAAAIAILRGARPTESLASTLSRLTSTGLPILDTRNSLTFPRIDVLAALGSVNDSLATDAALTQGSTNQTITTINALASNQFASKESGEPNHAGNPGGKSVWFEWTAPVAASVSIDTHGSSFDTLLAVYTGTSIAALTEVLSNDNDGSANGNSGLSFVASAGTVYRIAVDGFDGASGNILLNLQYDTFIAVGGGGPVQVPFMPPWALMLLALGLMGITRVAGRHEPAMERS